MPSVARGFSFPDSKSINHALFGAWYEEDIYDRFCTAVPVLPRLLRWRVAPAMRARNLIFVHVPRVAGTSIVRALYGQGCIHHYSMRYFQAIDPGFAQGAASFALLRDPFDRFVSGYGFVRAGGTQTSRLSDVFVRQTAHLKTVDDYLCFLEERGPLEMDFVMRPQSWFICDRVTGNSLVKDLFLLEEDGAALAAYLTCWKIASLPWLNRGSGVVVLLSAAQRRRIERLYADDFALIDSLRALRRKRVEETARGVAIAAE
jgi:hypothetical protein